MNTLATALTSLGTVALILGITACIVAVLVGTDPQTWACLLYTSPSPRD